MNSQFADAVEQFVVAEVAVFQANDALDDVGSPLTIAQAVEPPIKLVGCSNVQYVSYMIQIFKAPRRSLRYYPRFFAFPANGFSLALSATRIGTPCMSKLSRRLLVR